MSELKMEAAGPALALIDLGPIDDIKDHGCDEGDLAATGGNLYLHIDGVEYGSLWIHKEDDGTLRVSLGQFDWDEQQWVERSTIGALPDDPNS